MNNWNQKSLGDLADFYDSQRVPLSTMVRSTRQGEFPYYGASGVIDHIDDYIFDGQYLLIAEDGENLKSRNLPVAFIAKGKFWVNNHAHIIKGKQNIGSTDFIKYWFSQADINGYITGTAQPKLSQDNLKKIRIIAPDFNTQEKIVSILSVYDDLIENNKKRIKILEEMVQIIYTEWFVKFKFPGYEKVKMVDSELGKIPEGWEAKRLDDVAEIISGYAFKNSDFQDLGIPIVKIKNIRSDKTVRFLNTDFVSDQFLAEKYRKYFLYQGDIVLAMTGATAGKAGRIISNKKMLLNQRVAKVLPKEGYYSLVWSRLESDNAERELYRLAGGAAQPNMSTSQIGGVRVIVPNDNVLKHYERLAFIQLKQVIKLHNINSYLVKMRDLLTPQLVTGRRELKS